MSTSRSPIFPLTVDASLFTAAIIMRFNGLTDVRDGCCPLQASRCSFPVAVVEDNDSFIVCDRVFHNCNITQASALFCL